MPRFPEPVVYLATLGSMTAAALVVIALIILSAGDESVDNRAATVRAVVAEQNIAAGTEISEDMVKVIQVPEDQLVPGAFIEPSK